MATPDPSEYKTGNPVPSNKAEDVSDNARVFDVLINDQDNEEVLSRTGKKLTTVKGYTDKVLEVIRLGTGDNKGDYAVGVIFTKPNDTYTYNGQQWGIGVNFDLSNLPYEATEADPNNDPNLGVRGLGLHNSLEGRDEEDCHPATSIVMSDGKTVEQAVRINTILAS